MSDTKWTPGPWTTDQWFHFDSDSPYYNIAKNGIHDECRIAMVVPECGGSDREVEANAHLIAAAPILYEALRACLLMGSMPRAIEKKAESALAAARGEQS